MFLAKTLTCLANYILNIHRDGNFRNKGKKSEFSHKV